MTVNIYFLSQESDLTHLKRQYLRKDSERRKISLYNRKRRNLRIVCQPMIDDTIKSLTKYCVYRTTLNSRRYSKTCLVCGISFNEFQQAI